MTQKNKGKQVATESSRSKIDQKDFAFGKENYKWLLIALGFLFVGFILMIGGSSSDPKVFNYGMFNFQRLTLSPILLITGYVLGIYAIMKKPRQ